MWGAGWILPPLVAPRGELGRSYQLGVLSCGNCQATGNSARGRYKCKAEQTRHRTSEPGQSLLKLQQIENKLNFEEDDLLPEPSIRKGLQCEAFGELKAEEVSHGMIQQRRRPFDPSCPCWFFACSAKGPGSISKRGGSPQRPTSLRSCGLDKRSALNPKCTPSSSRTNDSGKFNCLLENCHSSRRMFWNERTNPLYNDVIDQDIPLSGVNQTTEAINQDLNGNPSTGAIPTRLHALVDVDLMENDWFMTGKQEGYRGSSPSNRGHLKGTPPVGPGNNLELDCSFKRRILQEKKSSPGPSVRTSFLSPPRSPFTQQLEPLLSKSPSNKLERLKERIRKQRKLQKKRQLEGSRLNLTQEQPIAVLGQKIGDPFKIGSMKCLVRKVTFGPPAPAYKGFNAIELMSDKKSSAGGEETEKASAVNTRASRRELVRRRDWGLPEQRRNSLKNPSRNHEATHKAQSFSKSPSPKRTAKVEERRETGRRGLLRPVASSGLGFGNGAEQHRREELRSVCNGLSLPHRLSFDSNPTRTSGIAPRNDSLGNQSSPAMPCGCEDSLV
uniref:uncharacterized protein n=1 Tax=Pristiophorus japonicus TaxID=55135 RepID=UPI00398E6B84